MVHGGCRWAGSRGAAACGDGQQHQALGPQQGGPAEAATCPRPAHGSRERGLRTLGGAVARPGSSQAGVTALQPQNLGLSRAGANARTAGEQHLPGAAGCSPAPRTSPAGDRCRPLGTSPTTGGTQAAGAAQGVAARDSADATEAGPAAPGGPETETSGQAAETEWPPAESGNPEAETTGDFPIRGFPGRAVPVDLHERADIAGPRRAGCGAVVTARASPKGRAAGRNPRRDVPADVGACELRSQPDPDPSCGTGLPDLPVAGTPLQHGVPLLQGGYRQDFDGGRGGPGSRPGAGRASHRHRRRPGFG